MVVERAKGVRRSVTLFGFEIEWIAKRVSENDQRSDFLGSLRWGSRVQMFEKSFGEVFGG